MAGGASFVRATIVYACVAMSVGCPDREGASPKRVDDPRRPSPPEQLVPSQEPSPSDAVEAAGSADSDSNVWKAMRAAASGAPSLIGDPQSVLPCNAPPETDCPRLYLCKALVQSQRASVTFDSGARPHASLWVLRYADRQAASAARASLLWFNGLGSVASPANIWGAVVRWNDATLVVLTGHRLQRASLSELAALLRGQREPAVREAQNRSDKLELDFLYTYAADRSASGEHDAALFALWKILYAWSDGDYFPGGDQDSQLLTRIRSDTRFEPFLGSPHMATFTSCARSPRWTKLRVATHGADR